MDELSQHERDLLDFEAGTFVGPGAKEAAITAQFGLGATNYYQQLNALLNTQAALAYNPVLVNRLRRLRQSRQRTPRRHQRPTDHCRLTGYRHAADARAAGTSPPCRPLHGGADMVDR